MLRLVLLLAFIAAAASQIPYVMGLTRMDGQKPQTASAMEPSSVKSNTTVTSPGAGVVLAADSRGTFSGNVPPEWKAGRRPDRYRRILYRDQ